MNKPLKIVIPSAARNLVVPLKINSARNISFIDADCFVGRYDVLAMTTPIESLN